MIGEPLIVKPVVMDGEDSGSSTLISDDKSSHIPFYKNKNINEIKLTTENHELIENKYIITKSDGMLKGLIYSVSVATERNQVTFCWGL